MCTTTKSWETVGELSSLVQLSLDRFGFNRSNLTRHTCVSLTSPGVTQDQKPHKQSCSSVPYSHGALVCVGLRCSSPRRCCACVCARTKGVWQGPGPVWVGERETGRRRCTAKGGKWCRKGQRPELARCKKEIASDCARLPGAQCRGTQDGTGVQVEITRLTIFYSTFVCLSHIFKSSEGNFKLKEWRVFFTVCVRGGTWEQREGGGLETQKSSICGFSILICFFIVF